MRYLSIKMAPSMPRKQRGVSLIESLISLLLIAMSGVICRKIKSSFHDGRFSSSTFKLFI